MNNQYISYDENTKRHIQIIYAQKEVKNGTVTISDKQEARMCKKFNNAICGNDNKTIKFLESDESRLSTIIQIQ